jgi:hypothetical protein
MKKLFLFLALFMITASSFAWQGTFISSCGRVVPVNVETNNLAQVAEILQHVNGRLCGTSNVKIIFY